MTDKAPVRRWVHRGWETPLSVHRGLTLRPSNVLSTGALTLEEAVSEEPLAVLLSEPGAGRSTELRRLCAGGGGAYLRADLPNRSTPAGPESGSTPDCLAVDNVDVLFRALGPLNAARRLHELVEGVATPKVLSFRSAWWNRYVAEVVEAAMGVQPVVLRLLPLDYASVDELCAVWGSGALRAEELARLGLLPFAGNPTMLRVLVERFPRGISETRRMDAANAILESATLEENPAHRVLGGRGTARSLQQMASLWFQGWHERRGRRSPLDLDARAPSNTFDSPLLVQSAEHQFQFRSVEVGAFLVAKRISEATGKLGLPAPWVLQRLQLDGAEELAREQRPLVAWLAALLPSARNYLIARDPLGVLGSGVVTTWSDEEKLRVWRAVETRASEVPFLRDEQPEIPEFLGHLVCAPVGTLVSATILAEVSGAGKRELTRLAVYVATHGRLDAAEEPLLQLARSRAEPRMRALAIDSLRLRSEHGVREELRALLEELSEDDEDEVLGALLGALRAFGLAMSDLLPHITRPKALNFYGRYRSFIYESARTMTPEEAIQVLEWAGEIDLLGDPRRRDQDRAGLASRALREAIAGVDWQPETALGWLQAVNGRHWSAVSNEDRKSVVEWFRERPAKWLSLLVAFLDDLHDELDPWVQYLQSGLRYYLPLFSNELSTPMLDLLKRTPNAPGAVLLFQSLFRLGPGFEGRPALDVLAESHASLGAIRDRFEAATLSAVEEEWKAEQQKLAEDIAEEREKAISFVRERLSDADGSIDEFALQLAVRLLGQPNGPHSGFPDSDKLVDRLPRLSEEQGPDYAAAVVEGLKRWWRTADPVSEEELVAHLTDAKSGLGHWRRLSLLLAAHLESSADSLTSAEARRLLLLGFLRYNSYPAWWPGLAARFEGEAASVLEALCASLTEEAILILGRGQESERIRRLRAEAAVRVLKTSPTAETVVLKGLLRFVLDGGVRLDEELIRSEVARSATEDPQRAAIWVGAFFLARPRAALPAIKAMVGPDKPVPLSTWLVALRGLLPVTGLLRSEGWLSQLPAEAVGWLARMLFATYGTSKRVGGAHWVGANEEAQFLRDSLLPELANRVEQEAGLVLEELERSKELEEVRDVVRHYRVEWSRKQAAHSLKPLDDQLEELLEAPSPAWVTSADRLWSLVVAWLLEIREEWERGRYSPVQLLWQDGASKTAPPRPRDEEAFQLALAAALAAKVARMNAHVSREEVVFWRSRTDIHVSLNGYTCPIELKREGDRRVKLGWKKQLLDKYMKQPRCGGRGVYVVGWWSGKELNGFGRWKAKDRRPEVLESRLQEAIDEELDEDRKSIRALVFNLSRPEFRS